MGLLLTTIAAGVVWIVLLSLGTKPFDALMLAMVMILIAATARLFKPFLPGNRREPGPRDRYTPR